MNAYLQAHHEHDGYADDHSHPEDVGPRLAQRMLLQAEQTAALFPVVKKYGSVQSVLSVNMR
nr:unnamed protein product [Callosobruchus analis]